MKIQPLTTAEENLMQIVWQLQSGYLKDIVEQHPEPKPHQNTISTYLKILLEKQFISAEKEGRIFRYSVAVPYEDYRKFQLRSFVENYYANSGKDLLKALLDDQLLTTKDFSDYVEVRTEAPEAIEKAKEETNPIADYIDELTSDKKKKKKKKKKDKKKDKKKKK